MKKVMKWLMIFSVMSLFCAYLPNLTAIHAQSGTYEPGTYEQTVDGFGGDVSVTVTVTEDAIEDIQVTQSETPGIGDEAIHEIISRVIHRQSLNVDIISGATYSSEAIVAAITAALAEAGADVESLAEIEYEEETNEITLTEADVIIIGGGGAGLAAAVSAHENGATVIVLEKMPRLGGNTILSGAAYNAADPERQKGLEMTDFERETVEAIIAEEQEDPLVQEWQATLAEEWATYNEAGETYLFDSPSLHKLQTYNGGDKKGKPELISVLADNAFEAVGWLEDKDMGFTDRIFTVLGGLWNRAHKPEKPLGTGYIEAFSTYIDENSEEMTVYLETNASDLIIEDGRVVGVVAENDGQTYEFMAANGVIIATGGFAVNAEMREEYNTKWPSLEELKSTNHAGATGDGIEIALQAEAALFGMEDIQLLPMGDPETGSLSGNIEQGVQNRIFVNYEGERFVDEGERRDVMTQALMEQTDGAMWVIVDKHSYPTGDTLNNFDESIDELVAADRAFEADTLEELAELIQVDPETFIATVETFNQAVAGESEDPFGRTLFQDPLNEAPFYAALRVPTVHHTMGGIMINTQAEVLNDAGEVIPGLYAAGEVTGAIHGANRLGGNALADIIVFGRIAGQKAAAELNDRTEEMLSETEEVTSQGEESESTSED